VAVSNWDMRFVQVGGQFSDNPGDWEQSYENGVSQYQTSLNCCGGGSCD
jgi:hypothetical protein